MKGDRRYPAGAAPAAALQLGQDIEHELRQIHRATEAHSSVAPVCCVTCTDSAGHPELYPCPTLRVARRLIRVRLAR